MKGLIKKETAAYSIFHLKCPRCQQGDLFTNKNPFHLNTMLSMPRKCPVCKQDFIFETGFYSAALWTSYPVVIVIAAINILIFNVWLHISGIWLLIITAIILLSLQPFIMRFGRAILISNFVKFDPAFRKK